MPLRGAVYLCTALAIPGLHSESQRSMWQAVAARCLVWGGGVCGLRLRHCFLRDLWSILC